MFKDRLKELRRESGISQENLGKIVHASKMAVSHWESGHSEPCISQLITIADYFEVSVDYLVGKKNE